VVGLTVVRRLQSPGHRPGDRRAGVARCPRSAHQKARRRA